MEDQHVIVPLVEGVSTSAAALGLAQTAKIGEIECRAVLPVRGPARGNWPVRLIGPPAPGETLEQSSIWPKWDYWGDPYSNSTIVQSIGIVLIGAMIPPGDEHLDFDRKVDQWRHLLRDWLAALAEGPTDFPDREYYGATVWGSSDYDHEDIPYQPHQVGQRRRPNPISAWAWSHALEHASKGDQPPLARTLMTSAIRAAMSANWRVAIIDATTAVEVALTTDLSAVLSDEASSRVTDALLKRSRTMGGRQKLAKEFGMQLPSRLDADLVEHRNAVAHQGADVTSTEVQAGISKAWEVMRQYNTLPVCCCEPVDGQTTNAAGNRGR